MFFFIHIHKGGNLMDVKGMSFDEAAKVIEQMRLDAQARNLPQQANALMIAIDCIRNWQHYRECVEDDCK